MPGARTLRRLLILGGTAEAAELAALVLARHGERIEPITSLAGVTEEPNVPPGGVRRGGFGGAEGLARYLADEAIAFLIDATHPFAATMQQSAAIAAAAAGVPRLRLLRPPWPKVEGDRWIEVADAQAAAQALAPLGRNVFLALGGREIAAFAGLGGFRFVVRGVSPPAQPLPANWQFLQARGPFAAADERRLFEQRQIDAVVSRQSGGAGAYAKIAAARMLGLPVVMIRRPSAPPPPVAPGVAEALDWLERRLGG
jgi:precorrin-6A/cobalt-precorrin-6A reductase